MSAELHNTVNLFGTIAKELHSSLELPVFCTLHKVNELQQHGDSSSSELTSTGTNYHLSQNWGLIVLSGVIHSSLKFRWMQPRGLLTKISNYWKWTFSAHTCKGTCHVSFAAKKSKHSTHRLNDNHSQKKTRMGWRRRCTRNEAQSHWKSLEGRPICSLHKKSRFLAPA